MVIRLQRQIHLHLGNTFINLKTRAKYTFHHHSLQFRKELLIIFKQTMRHRPCFALFINTAKQIDMYAKRRLQNTHPNSTGVQSLSRYLFSSLLSCATLERGKFGLAW